MEQVLLIAVLEELVQLVKEIMVVPVDQMQTLEAVVVELALLVLMHVETMEVPVELE